MTEISIVLPAYNEAANLEKILPRLNDVMHKLQKSYEILIIDTIEKTDETEEICQKNNVTYLHRENGNLYGDAIRTGFAKAKGKYLVVMDADGSHDPFVIPQMYSVMNGQNADVVIGSRYCRNGSTDNNLILQFMSWALNVTYRTMFRLRVRDVSDSFRMYRTEILHSISLECDNFDVVEEILILLRCQYPNIKMIEIPIRFSKRAEGKSKRDLVRFVISYVQTMKKLLRIQAAARRRNSK